MSDDPVLKLSIGDINRRLTFLARERKRLQSLLKIAIQALEDAEGCPPLPDVPEKETTPPAPEPPPG